MGFGAGRCLLFLTRAGRGVRLAGLDPDAVGVGEVVQRIPHGVEVGPVLGVGQFINRLMQVGELVVLFEPAVPLDGADDRVAPFVEWQLAVVEDGGDVEPVFLVGFACGAALFGDVVALEHAFRWCVVFRGPSVTGVRQWCGGIRPLDRSPVAVTELAGGDVPDH
jgi:hypothetical protein